MLALIIFPFSEVLAERSFEFQDYIVDRLTPKGIQFMSPEAPQSLSVYLDQEIGQSLSATPNLSGV